MAFRPWHQIRIYVNRIKDGWLTGVVVLNGLFSGIGSGPPVVLIFFLSPDRFGFVQCFALINPPGRDNKRITFLLPDPLLQRNLHEPAWYPAFFFFGGLILHIQSVAGFNGRFSLGARAFRSPGLPGKAPGNSLGL